MSPLNACRYLSYDRVRGQLRFLRPSSEPSPQLLIDLKPDQRNMLYFLLVASLVFAIPGDLLRAALEITQIPKMDGHDPAAFFFWPTWCRAKMVCLLASAAELPAGENATETQAATASLYPQLRDCLLSYSRRMLRMTKPPTGPQDLDSRSIRPSGDDRYAAQSAKKGLEKVVPRLSLGDTAMMERDFGNLLAVELSQLLCLVPEFTSCIGRDGDHGLIQILEKATEDSHLYAKLMVMIDAAERGSRVAPEDKAEGEQDDTWTVTYRKVSVFLLERIRKNGAANGLDVNTSFSSVFSTSDVNRRGTEAEASSHQLPMLKKPRARTAPFQHTQAVTVGETVYMENGQTARVIGMPEAHVVMLQFNPFSVPFSGSEGHRSGPSYVKFNKSVLIRDRRGRLMLPKAGDGLLHQPRVGSASTRKSPVWDGSRRIMSAAGPRRPAAAAATAGSDRRVASARGTVRSAMAPLLTGVEAVAGANAASTARNELELDLSFSTRPDEDVDEDVDDELLWAAEEDDGFRDSASPFATGLVTPTPDIDAIRASVSPPPLDESEAEDEIFDEVGAAVMTMSVQVTTSRDTSDTNRVAVAVALKAKEEPARPSSAAAVVSMAAAAIPSVTPLLDVDSPGAAQGLPARPMTGGGPLSLRLPRPLDPEAGPPRVTMLTMSSNFEQPQTTGDVRGGRTGRQNGRLASARLSKSTDWRPPRLSQDPKAPSGLTVSGVNMSFS